LLNQVVSVSDKDDSDEATCLERLNEELARSLKRCRTLLHHYEARLAANSNDAEDPNDDEEARGA